MCSPISITCTHIIIYTPISITCTCTCTPNSITCTDLYTPLVIHAHTCTRIFTHNNEISKASLHV